MENRVGYQLKRAQHSLRLRTDATLRTLSLTTPQYAALSGIERQPGTSSALLARQSFVTAQTMNEIVGLLVNRNLVERRCHPENRRIIQLFLTVAGQTLLEQAHLLVAIIEEQMVVALAEEERLQLTHWLRQCSDTLEAELTNNQDINR